MIQLLEVVLQIVFMVVTEGMYFTEVLDWTP